ncbi:helix-turn-helix transcriptional regulator [Natronobacterium texcoconense]|uniref:helix-turn-helix transcriptional regulator n=1 Tax=Natronobacterium texcoconense TaxID=1095778 RepID=UPI003139DCBC
MQLINPTPVVVSVGDNGSDVVEAGEQFRYTEVGIITVAAWVMGASMLYLVVSVERGSVLTEPSTTTSSAESSVQTDGTERPVHLEFTDDVNSLVERHRTQFDETTDRLDDTEREIYSMVLDADGKIQQREIVADTDFSKATVTRTLDSLETKGLLERKRQGVGNVVVLQESASP